MTTRLPREYGLAPHEIQVLSPMHRGELGAGNLNQLLQEALTTGAAGVERGARSLRVGDKVMQMRNDYDKEVWNGDIGVIERIDTEARDAVVRFDDRAVEYGLDELDKLALAYAATVHKSQGSEYPAVVIPVHTQHFVMLQRNLLYTAVTRGKRLVVLVGTRKALGLAVRNADVAARCSGLAARLRAGAARPKTSRRRWLRTPYELFAGARDLQVVERADAQEHVRAGCGTRTGTNRWPIARDRLASERTTLVCERDADRRHDADIFGDVQVVSASRADADSFPAVGADQGRDLRADRDDRHDEVVARSAGSRPSTRRD